MVTHDPHLAVNRRRASLRARTGLSAQALRNRLRQTGRAVRNWPRRYGPGLLLCLFTSALAALTARLTGLPIMLNALVFGMVGAYGLQTYRASQQRAIAAGAREGEGLAPAQHDIFHDGLQLSGRQILRLGIILLGAGVTLQQIAALGLPVFTLVLTALSSTLIVGAWIGRRLGLSADFAILSAGSVAICGASAAMTLSTVLPKSDDLELQTCLTVLGVTALSTLAMVAYPILTAAVGASDIQAGIFFGAAIHDVAQVMGAGLMVSEDAVETAAIVKLARVALLAPVALIVGYLFYRQHKIDAPMPERGAPSARRRIAAPWFLVGFLALVAINSIGVIAPALSEVLATSSRACLVISVAALGLKAPLSRFREAGATPLIVMSVQTLWLAVIVTAGLMLMAVL